MSNLFYWRDNIGTEVDLILEEGAQLFAAEIKSGQTHLPEFTHSLRKGQGHAKSFATPALINGGDERFDHLDTGVIAWRDL